MRAVVPPLPLPPRTAPAWAELYAAHVQDVARWVSRLGGPDSDLEDLVQETFLVARQKLPAFRGEAKTSTWLFRICHNVVRGKRRRLSWRRWLGGDSNETAGHLVDPGPAPDVQLDQRRSVAALYRALDRLREPKRTVLILFELEGMSGEQIAELTGVKPGTVWVQLHRARQELAVLLKAQQPQEELS
ncbi:MAG: sigma-70 family RNA polymerase sigma factor [Myxococcota bacterium]|nr:sigma-70 family RNA polymerase sigma factor [Myxococcota bacterium]